MKTCGRCQVDRYEQDFYLHPGTKDGLQFWCKDCFKDYEETKAGRKQCVRCLVYRAPRKFFNNSELCSNCRWLIGHGTI